MLNVLHSQILSYMKAAILLVFALSIPSNAFAGMDHLAQAYLTHEQKDILKAVKEGRTVVVLLQKERCFLAECEETRERMGSFFKALEREFRAKAKFAAFDVPSIFEVTLYLYWDLGVTKLPSLLLFREGKMAGKPLTVEDIYPRYEEISAEFFSQRSITPSDSVRGSNRQKGGY